MIRKITIKSFKSLLDVEVELGQVNVFIGANGSGKSNLLEALGVLGAAASGRIDDESLKHRGVRPGVPALYKSSFQGHRVRNSIRLEANSFDASYEVELNNPIQDPEPAWRYKTETVHEKGDKILGRSPGSIQKFAPDRGLAALKAVEWAVSAPAATLLNRLEGYAIYGPNTDTLRGIISDPQQRLPVGLAGGRLPEAVLDLLKLKNEGTNSDIFELIGWASSISSRPAGADVPLSPSVAAAQQILYFKDRFMADGRNGLTGYDASEGALYVLFAAVLATSRAAPSSLAIDNFDHGLNPRLARLLAAKICDWVLGGSEEKQMFLTSHNPLVLDGLPLDNDEVRLFGVARSRKGRTVVRRINIDSNMLKRDGELWTVSRLWVMGHLGAMPNV